MNKETIKNAFKTYVSDYDVADPKIALKIAHTYRVADISECIAKALNLNSDDIQLSWAIGMLHDIARFEQIRIYGTFEDAKSVDHAEFGVKLLFEEMLIDKFDVDENLYPVINIAIKNHNKFRLPDNLTSYEEKFCKIIRDADKIDILRVNYETPMEEIYNTTRDVLLNDNISDAVFNAFFENSAVNHSIKETVIDRLVGHISLCFELEYEISREILLEQGYLIKLMDFKSNNPQTNERLDIIRKYILQYLNATSCMKKSL